MKKLLLTITIAASMTSVYAEEMTGTDCKYSVQNGRNNTPKGQQIISTEATQEASAKSGNATNK